jgi:ubiquinone biosynthesis protein Coq4
LLKETAACFYTYAYCVILFRYMLERLLETEEGREIMASRPRVNGQSLERLAGLPQTTVGGTYFAFMKQ